MATFNKYPYSNFQELNLDWILQELKDLTDKWDVFEDQFTGMTANAQTVPYGNGASVTVTGGGATPYNFDFDIPAGKDLGLVGQPSVKYQTSNDISTIPSGTWLDNPPTSITPGDYLWTRIVLTYNDNHTIVYYMYTRQGMDGNGSVDSVNGILPIAGNVTLPIPDPSDAIPLVDITGGLEGLSPKYSRADHQHPTDPSKLDVATGNAGEKNAYIIDGINTQTTMGITSTPTANTIACYDANDRLNTADPSANSNAVNLGFANSTYLNKTDAVTDYVQKTDVATSSTLGIVQPDNATIVIDADGILSAAASLNITTVYSNPNVGQRINAGTYSMDVTDTDALMFIATFRQSTSVQGRASILIPAVNVQYQCNSITNNYMIARAITISSDKSEFTLSTEFKWDNVYGQSPSTTPVTPVMVLDKIYSIK